MCSCTALPRGDVSCSETNDPLFKTLHAVRRARCHSALWMRAAGDFEILDTVTSIEHIVQAILKQGVQKIKQIIQSHVLITRKTSHEIVQSTIRAKVQSPEIGSPIWTPFRFHFLKMFILFGEMKRFCHCFLKALSLQCFGCFLEQVETLKCS